ncbi:MAG TPA: DUF4136 domain-containing protein [Vicinamibacterales bacterium]|nr:DUF4136 domain-containing protein [Vicinamibacterales bacterium]
MKHAAVVVLLAGIAGAPILAQAPKYGVSTTAAKGTDFSKFKTYRWEHGWQSPDKTIHEGIVAAIDRELGAVGLEKKSSGTTDLLVTYASLRRIDVDLDSKPTEGEAGRRQYDVGTLVVLMLEPGSRKELFRARVDQPITIDRDKAQAIIDTAVTEMFQKYPTKAGKK